MLWFSKFGIHWVYLLYFLEKKSLFTCHGTVIFYTKIRLENLTIMQAEKNTHFREHFLITDSLIRNRIVLIDNKNINQNKYSRMMLCIGVHIFVCSLTNLNSWLVYCNYLSRFSLDFLYYILFFSDALRMAFKALFIFLN